MTIGDLCRRDVATCNKDTPVTELAALMREYHVGDLIVVDEQAGSQRPLGIVTDRDLVIEVLAKDVDMQSITASATSCRHACGNTSALEGAPSSRQARRPSLSSRGLTRRGRSARTDS